jgi:hypothetical protein
MSIRHQNLVKRVLLHLSSVGIMCWQGPTGVAKSMDGKRTIRFGLDGHSDVAGVIPPSGRALYAEIKIPPDKQSEDQKNFQSAVEKRGARYIVVTPENFELFKKEFP